MIRIKQSHKRMSSTTVSRGSFEDYVGFSSCYSSDQMCQAGSSGPAAPGLQSRPCNSQLVAAFLIPSSPLGEISRSLALPITRSKHMVSSKMPLVAGLDPISLDQICAAVGLEPELVYSRTDCPITPLSIRLTCSIR